MGASNSFMKPPRILLLWLGAGLVLQSCQPETPVAVPSSPSATATALGQPPVSGPSPLPPKGAPPAPLTPSPTPIPPSALPAGLAGIRFGEIDRFLDALSERAYFDVVFVNQAGEPLKLSAQELAQLGLSWSSSRPQDFSVDPKGEIRPWVSYGFSIITARIPGTDFSTSAVVNITANNAGGGGGSGSAGGGGGGGSTGPNNTPPVILSLTANPTRVVGGGGLVRLSAHVQDAETPLTEQSYTWSCTPQAACGTFSSPSGKMVFWRGPNTAGVFPLQLTVSDGLLSAQRSVSITVETGSGSLQINP